MENVWLKHYDSFVPPRLTYPRETLYPLLVRAARENHDRTATIFMDSQETFGRLLEQVDRLAAGLNRLGVRQGDRMVLALPSSPQFVVAYFALHKLGAVAVMLNPLSTPREIDFKCRNSEAKGLIALDMFYDQFLPAARKAELDLIIFSGIFDLHPDGAAKQNYPDNDALDFLALVDSEKGRVEAVDVALDDLAVIIYTGGTTGDPKGTMLSHRNIITNAWAIGSWFEIRPSDRGLAVLPFFHGFGMQVMLNTYLLAGASLVIMPTFDIDTFFKLISQYKPTGMVGVPTMYVAINNFADREKYDLSSIKIAVSGGAPLPLAVKKAFEGLTGGILLEGYGLTESTCAVCCNPFQGENKEGSIGLPMSDVEMKIVDLDTGTRDLPPGEAGEILVKSPMVMLGYYNNPEATRETIRDGWLFTGDIGTMDEKGYFRIVDRKKEMIIAGGFNIYPKEVENILSNHPAVMEVAVVGVPDQYRGETVKAFIVNRPGASVSEEELVEFCRENMIRYMIPKIFEFREDLPKSPVGKILKKTLKEEETIHKGE